MPIVKMPDGTQVRFPDEMPADQIRSMITSKFPELAPKPGLIDRAKSAVEGAMTPTSALEGADIAELNHNRDPLPQDFPIQNDLSTTGDRAITNSLAQQLPTGGAPMTDAEDAQASMAKTSDFLRHQDTNPLNTSIAAGKISPEQSLSYATDASTRVNEREAARVAQEEQAVKRARMESLRILARSETPEGVRARDILAEENGIEARRQDQRNFANQNPTISDTATDFRSGVAKVPGAFVGLIDIAPALIVGGRPADKLFSAVGEATGFHPAEYAAELERGYSNIRKQGIKDIAAVWDDETKTWWDVTKAYADNPRVTAGSVIQSLPSMAAGGAIGRVAMLRNAGLAPVTAGAVGEGSIMAGQQMEGIGRSADQRVAALASLATGVMGAAVGKYSGALASKMGILDVDTLLAGGTANAVAMPFYKRIPAAMVQEGVIEEGSQSSMEQMLKNIAEDKPVTEGVQRATVEGILAGSAMGGAVALPQGSVGAKPDALPAVQSQESHPMAAAHEAAASVLVQPTVDDAIRAAEESIGTKTNDELLNKLNILAGIEPSTSPAEGGMAATSPSLEQQAAPITEQVNAIPEPAQPQPDLSAATEAQPDNMGGLEPAGGGTANQPLGGDTVPQRVAAGEAGGQVGTEGAVPDVGAIQQPSGVTPEKQAIISAKPAETAQKPAETTISSPITEPATTPQSVPTFGTNSAGKITLRGVPMEKIQAVRDKLKLKGVIVGKDSAVFPKGTDLKALQAEFGMEVTKPAPKAKKARVASTDLRGRIIQLGGINSKYASDVTGEKNPGGAWKFAFGKNGLGLDDMATQLAADGFDINMNDESDNGGVDQLTEMIRAHIANKGGNFKATTQEAAAETEHADRNMEAMRLRAQQLGIKYKGLGDREIEDAIYAAEDAIAMDAIAEREALQAEALEVHELADMIEGGIEVPFGDEVQTDNAALAAFLGEDNGKESGTNTEQSIGEQAQASAERGARTGGESQGSESPLLESYTNAEVLAREAAKDKAEEEARAAEAKDKADKEVGDFALTGSNRAADVGAANGQTDIFSAEKLPGTQAMAQRQVNASNKFIDSVVEQFGLTREEAGRAWDYFVKNKLVKVDAIGGQYNLKDGRLWDAEAMRTAAAAPTEKTTKSKKEPSSWVIKNKETGEVIMETFDKKKVDALNTEKYEAVPIGEHLSSLNTVTYKETVEKNHAAQKKLEVLKAQAQGKISGDQGAALKELADAGEHAAVDEVLNGEAIDTSAKPVEKSAENVQEDQAKIDNTGGIMFSKAKGGEPTLIIQHNLTEQNLLHADRMGGIPIPSLAITKADHPLEGFGEITLVGGIDMADPKGYAATKVFGADIYSPRYPKITHKVTSKAMDVFNRKFEEMNNLTGARQVYPDDISSEGMEAISNNAAVMAYFLTGKGITPKVVTEDTPKLDEELMPFKDDQRMDGDLAKDPEFQAAAIKHRNRTLLALYEGDEELAKQEYITKETDGFGRLMISYARDVSKYQRDMREAGKPNKWKTKTAIREQIDKANLGDEFNDYAQSVMDSLSPEEKIFQGFTNSGNRKYIEHTLDNVIKLLKKELRGGENFNYGVGTIRSKFTPQFKSIAQIRAAKDRLMDNEKFSEVKSEIDEDFDNLANEFREYHPIGDKFGFLDTMSGTLYDAATMGLPRAFRENGFESVPEEKLKDAAEFLDKLRTLPTEYFEAKILRAVDLSEFKGAVVPEGISQKALDVLKARGITNVLTYNNSDTNDRASKIKQLAQQADLLFSKSSGQVTNPHTPDTLRQSIIESFDGKAKSAISAMFDSGKAKAVSSEEAKGIVGEDALYSKAQEETPEFKKWFGDSKVVDEDGNPLVVYHGTQADFTEFDTKKMYSGEGATQSGSGFYFTTKPDSASNYAKMKGDEGSKVLPVYLSIKKPLHIDFKDGEVFGAEHEFNRAEVKKILLLAPYIKSKEDSPLMNFGDIAYEGFDKVLNEAIDAYAGSNNFAALRNDFFGDNHRAWLGALNKVLGYDGAYSKLEDGTIHYVAWKPEQVKSAIGNSGQFDPKNPDIRYSKTGQAKAFYDPKTDTSYFIADRISKDAKPEALKGLALHEISVHALKLGKDSAEFKSILQQLEMMRKAGNKKVLEAYDRVPLDTKPEHVGEEAIAYLIEAHPTLPIMKRVWAWFRNALRALGKSMPMMQRMKINEWANSLNESDLIWLAHDAMANSQDAPERETQGDYAMASRAEQSPESFARMFMEEFTADNDMAFKHAKSTSKNLSTVLDEVAKAEYAGDGTRADENQESGADERHFYTTETGLSFQVFETPREVWIDVSKLEPRSGGQAIYAAVANYAYNTGKKFIGDPNGLTAAAVIRRTSNMLSSAMQFGTTQHLEPARQQETATRNDGSKIPGVVPLEWHGQNIDKIDALIHTLVGTTQNLFPEIKRWRYDFDTNTFRDGDGKPISAATLSSLRHDDGRGMDDSQRLGESTARRVVLLQSLISEAGAGVGKRSQILEQLLRWGNTNASQRDGGYPDNLTRLFSKSAPESIPEETGPQAIQRVVQDKMVRFQVIRDWLASQGKALTEKADVWMNEGNMHGKIAARSQDFREKTVQPLIEKTQKAGFTMGQVAEYLEMKHIPEANARMRQIHGDPDATANGVEDSAAKAVLAQYQAMPNFAKLEAVAKEWQAISSSTREILVKSGIITSDMARAWQATYQNYVPLKGDEEQKGSGTGNGLNVNGKTKRRLGHGDREEAVIQNMLRDHERAIQLSEKNAVGISLVHMAVEAQNPELLTVGKPVLRQTFKDKTVFEVQYKGVPVGSFDTDRAAQDFILRDAAMSKRQKSSYGITQSRDQSVAMMASPMLADNEVNVYINGHAVRVQLNDELLARAYTNMGVEHVGLLLTGAREFNSWLSKAYTGYNPEFALVNLSRDMFAGSINLTGDYGIGMTAKIYANYPRAIKELVKSFRDPAKSKLIADYRASGGNTGAAYLSDLERIGKDVMGAYNEYAGTVDTLGRVYSENRQEGRGKFVAGAKATGSAIAAGYKHIPFIGHFLKLMEHMNGVTENALRVATFDTLRKNGYSDAKAAQAAKMSTVNFNRKGEISNAAGALYLFFNPAVQGTQRAVSVLTSSKHKGQARALAGMMAFGAFVIAEAMRGGDDDDKKKWNQTPDYVKDRNIVINLGDDQQFTIPLPYEYGLFWSLGNLLSDAVHGANGWKLGIRLSDAILGNFSPIGNPIEKGEATPVDILPTALKMIISPSLGKEGQDSFGRPLLPRKFSDAKPDSQTMFRSSKGTPYAAAAEMMNTATGGDAYHKGHVDVSPETLKYWVSSLTGGTGKFAMDSITLGSNIAQGVDSVDLREMPVVRKFVRESGVSDARQLYYQHVNEAKEAADALTFAKQARDPSGAQKIVGEDLAQIKLAAYAAAYHKQLKSYSDLVDAIRLDDNLTLNEKRLQMKMYEKKEQAVYDAFDKHFTKLMGDKTKP